MLKCLTLQVLIHYQEPLLFPKKSLLLHSLSIVVINISSSKRVQLEVELEMLMELSASKYF